MGLYAMADFHLAIGVADKPMDVFGKVWQNYMTKIEENCRKVLTDNDVLLIPGDVSWGTYTSQAENDLKFINSLPGKKVISRGNHDYWWTSAKKLDELKEKLQLDTLIFLHNSFYQYENTAICANRGWNYSLSEENVKIYKRELLRMELSLQMAEKAGFSEKIAVTHYPPVTPDGNVDENYLAFFEKYGVTLCLYGHLHNVRKENVFEGMAKNVEFRLVSADYLEFMPFRIK